jgi:membrane protease YdiL (CAAX protease family)
MAADLTSLDTIQTQNPIRAIITRFPFLVYAILTLLLGWIPWYAGGQPSHLFFVPLLTALIMAPLVGGREGLMNFLRRMVRLRAPWYTWLVALFLPGAIALGAIAVHVLLGGQAPDAAFLNLSAGSLGQVAFIAVSFFLPLGSDNVGEFGFRGFGLPALQGKWGSLLGTLILGLFVSLWFLPQFFNPDSPQTSMGGMRFFPFFVVTEVGWSFMMTWVYNKSGGSSLIAGYLFHSAFNFWTVALLVNASVESGQLAFASTFDTKLLTINAVLIGLTAVGFIVATRGELGNRSGRNPSIEIP